MRISKKHLGAFGAVMGTALAATVLLSTPASARASDNSHVALCMDYNLGRCETFPDSYWNMGGTTPGIPTNMNDKVSSVNNVTDHWECFYKDYGFSNGPWAVPPHTWTNVPSGWNDVISSLNPC
ncbi:peptidase inhibitor family I36 protein (plasmid) [Streptomyces sp. FXJ1.172]|nr:peptidase inhibitor family I36 protein [Streptomyces sp. FXJ1.172]WEP00554.1 hypothetical protein A6P39_043220 [Streptomyces sp. FXJ1.172]